MLERARTFLERHEKRLSVSAFLLGFLIDSLTLTRIDRLFDNLVLVSYLLAAFAGIVILNAHGAGRFRRPLLERGVNLVRFLLPFAFGGLFSGFLIFYSRSGPVLASAPFLLVLALFFFGNELWKKHYERFIFQLTVFFVVLFAYAALVVPVLMGRIGAGIFLLSGLLSLGVFFLLFLLLKKVAPEEAAKGRRTLIPVIVIISIIFNFLYFNNMIPPIPLSIKEVGIYQSVSRTRSGEYVLTFEPPRWFEFGRATSKTVHWSGRPLYAWSSVYAPTRFDTSVVHRWSKYDEDAGKWQSINAIPFTISGGRLEGFRGYSIKENVTLGKWRVDVETAQGQLIGRIVFTVEAAAILPPVVTETR